VSGQSIRGRHGAIVAENSQEHARLSS
jgi:hypothetical protein